MEAETLKYFLTQGPFAILFVWLLVYVMRANKERESRMEETNKEREGRLHELLDKFSEKYDVVIDELRDIKNKMGGGQ
ncbi:BhlA/UviB family holin-like peptide [Cytobacillus gottheilii]|uniref:BhlA-like holin n=1 Tax=Cytobacillus gottheilii TaxID=859144 RepID=A0ABX8FG64_9BACI|nr:BhlA/UviB family holin-like peptide [Cytobacillus gottheilii]QVY63001.1 hypothetical protein J1899_08155 [Cytobacillus gottheilii]